MPDHKLCPTCSAREGCPLRQKAHLESLDTFKCINTFVYDFFNEIMTDEWVEAEKAIAKHPEVDNKQFRDSNALFILIVSVVTFAQLVSASPQWVVNTLMESMGFAEAKAESLDEFLKEHLNVEEKEETPESGSGTYQVPKKKWIM